MRKIICLALATLIFCPSATYAKPLIKKVISKPTVGTLQAAIDAAASTSYIKVTDIVSYNGTSLFPYSEKDPLTTNYTQAGLYMVERGSGYYTYDSKIYHISKNGENETRGVAISDFSTYSAFFRTLLDFGGSYASGHLVADTSDNDGLTFKNNGSTYSQADILSMIYFIAPLVSVGEGATFSDYSFLFKLA